MTDRISQMSRDELEAATRELVRSVNEASSTSAAQRVALRPFHPTALDKVRELLKAEGFIVVEALYARRPGVLLYVRGNEPEVWTKP